MTEEGKNAKYIICSKCRSEDVNDEEHIHKDFGCTRLEMRYKTCVRCRAINNINYKTYSEKHPEHKNNIEKNIKKTRTSMTNNTERNNADRLKEYDRARNQLTIYCPHCNGEIIKVILHSCNG